MRGNLATWNGTRLKDFIYEVLKEEVAELERQIRRDGAPRDALVVWPTERGLVLVDGHHRLAICRRQGLPFRVEERHFESREAVLRAVTEGGASFSAIAMACGRVKRDSRGNHSGETSWLARRVGLGAGQPGAGPESWSLLRWLQRKRHRS